MTREHVQNIKGISDADRALALELLYTAVDEPKEAKREMTVTERMVAAMLETMLMTGTFSQSKLVEELEAMQIAAAALIAKIGIKELAKI